MSKEFNKAVDDIEFERQTRDDIADLMRRYGLPIEIAKRIRETAATIDQAHAIAELMR